MPELLPCPFCGDAPEIVLGNRSFLDAEVHCPCGIEGPNFDWVPPEDAVISRSAIRDRNIADATTHWNTRKS